MKKIEELAQEYADSGLFINKHEKIIASRAFTDGYKAAKEWISVYDEEKPENREMVLLKVEYSGTKYITTGETLNGMFIPDDEYYQNAKITHWRAI